jgi:hypothetical protein
MPANGTPQSQGLGLVAGLRRGRGRRADPVGVAGGPLAIGSHLGQHRIDEPHKVRMLLGDGQAVWVVGELRPDKLGLGVLCGEPDQDGGVNRDRGNVALLQQDETVGPVRDRYRDGATATLASEIDPLVAQTFCPPRSAVLLAGEFFATRTR